MSSKEGENSQKMIRLLLAEKMCKKFIDEGKVESEAEIDLFLMILERQEKYEDMLKVLKGPLKDKLISHSEFLPQRKAELLYALKMYKDSFEAYKELVEHNPDQFTYYTSIYDVACKLDKEEDENSQGKSNRYLSDIIDLLHKCIEKHANSKSGKVRKTLLRGPYIAKIELFLLLNTRHKPQEVSDLLERISTSKVDLFVEYFELFSTKYVCITDICHLLLKTELTKEECELVRF